MLEACLTKYLAGKEAAILARLKELVEIESSSYDKEGVDRAGAYLIKQLKRIGFDIEVHPQNEVGDQIIGHRTFGRKGRILILGHLDTVWPTGTIEKWPFAHTEAGCVTGPGVGDMKGGLIVALAAMEALIACDLCHLESISFLLIPDEELGSPNSREIIEARGQKSDWVFVMEPGRANGAVVTQRAVLGKFILSALGRSAHCGCDYKEGASAVRELAAKVEPMEALSDVNKGILVNVGVFRGGEARQVVPAQAEMHIDFRAPDQPMADRLMARLREMALNTKNSKVQLSLEGGQTRPAFPRSAGTLALYRRALTIADGLNISLPEDHTNGGSDGSFVAAMGIPTLDGLGPISLDDCSRRERVVIKSLIPRTLLLANLMAQLGEERNKI